MSEIIFRCKPFCRPINRVDEPDPTRPGWYRTTCATCKAFLGYWCEDRDAKVARKVFVVHPMSMFEGVENPPVEVWPLAITEGGAE